MPLLKSPRSFSPAPWAAASMFLVNLPASASLLFLAVELEEVAVEFVVLYEEFVFRGAFALPVEDREADSLMGLFCDILKIDCNSRICFFSTKYT